ncbi:MAG: Gfo/Idh/MocA family oxidoreductase, partial [Kineothrix sp.]|nr:Gfo/Idh/MocA family oxidoreductase [Kineothrix sp.]
AIAAMEKGMNVLVEKPVCLTKEDGERILEAEKRTGVKVMVGQVVRFFEEYSYVRQAYLDKRFGSLKSIVMQRISGDVTWGFEDWFHDEQKSGSVVLDLHVHDVDFLRYMLGEPDDFDVRATAFDSGMINQVITTYRFGDVIATAEGVWDISPALKFQANFRACFEDATVVFNGAENPSLKVFKKDGTVETPELAQEYNVTSDAAGINVSNLGPYYTEIKYFVECVQEGKGIEMAQVCEGVKSVELALKEWEAAKDYVKKI